MLGVTSMQGVVLAVALSGVVALATATAPMGALPPIPSVPLRNSARPGVRMPAIGLGTGGYGSNASAPYGSYPECWSAPAGCGDYVTKALTTWLQVAGPAASPQAPTRLDSATSYQNQEVVGAAVAASGVPRENLWLLSKVGPSQPLGHDDALAEFKTIQAALQTDYVDALLVHWPFQNPSAGNVTTNVTVSSDPACQHKNPAFNATRCRLDTWRALVEIYESGGAKSIGVSNYGIAELTEIIDAGLPLPALNQCPFHIYRSSNQAALRAFCEAHGILFIGYSPLGVPDWHDFSPDFAGAPHTQLQDEVVLEVAANHPGFTPAQVLLAWQWAHGVPFNPRTTSREHMEENIRSFNLKLSDDEVAELDARPNPTCAQDPW